MENDTQTESVPKGFEIIPDTEKGSLYILHRQTAMYVGNGFLMVWLIFWGMLCISLLHDYVQDFSDGIRVFSLLLIAICWAAEIYVAYLLTYYFFGKKLYILTPHELVVETTVLRYRNAKTIPLRSIKLFRQVKDGGENEDSFPSWGLVVEANKKVTLLYRQEYEKSHWLGQTLADWTGVDFIKVPED